MSSAPKPREPLDPVFVNSRREATIIFCLWLIGLCWCVPYCYLNGYVTEFSAERFGTILGIPSWLFWGIGVPWIIADVFTTWFCFWYMKDDDLGQAEEGSAPPASAQKQPSAPGGEERT